MAETAKAAEFFMADGVIITGQCTGDPAAPSDFKGKSISIACSFPCLYLRIDTADVAKTVNIPIMAGSGVTCSNLAKYAEAHALIIGSDFKRDGRYYIYSNVRLFTCRYSLIC